MLVELRQDNIEPLIGPELGRRTLDVPLAVLFGTACYAQVHDDVDRAAFPLGPAQLVIREALLIRDRVGILPGMTPNSLGLSTRIGSLRGALRGVLVEAMARHLTVTNHTPGSIFMRAIKRSSMAIHKAPPRNQQVESQC